MDKKVERLLTIIKGGVKERPTFGTDPNDPWSAKSSVTESGELDNYLKYKGIDPTRLSRETKLSHAKSGSFAKWKMDRKFTEEVEQVDEKIKVKVSTDKPIGFKVADIGPGKKEYNVKTDKVWDDQQKKKTQKEEVTIDEDVKSIIHKIKSDYHKKKIDKAFDKGDEGAFAKHSDLSTYHHIKSGGKPPQQVDDVNKYMNYVKNKYGLKEEIITEDDLLNAYLKTRGINPKTASKISKIAASKTGDFNKWKMQHMRGGRLPVAPRTEQVTWKASPTLKRQKTLDKAFQKSKPIRIAGPDLHREEADKKDTITMDIPLLIRMLELAREDIKTDAQLHRIVEKLIDIRNKGTLTMDDYDFVAKLKEQFFPEDTYQDSYAATQTVGPEVTSSDDTEKNQNESKAAKMIKSLKKTVKEDLYDWEKENKSVASYGKKPKMDASPNDPKAAGIIYGGKTLTGQSRDVIELDPMMKKPNPQPDFAKKANIDKK